MTADPAIRAALREAGEAALDAYEEDRDHRGIAAAAVAAFLRALPMSSLFIHGQPLTISSLISNEDLAEQVEAAAREPSP